MADEPMSGDTDPARTVLLDVHPGRWPDLHGRVRPWLTTTLTLQTTFRRLAGGVARSVDEPHIHSYLEDMAGRARGHEEDIRALSTAFRLGRGPRTALVAPLVLSVTRRASAQVTGRVGGARGTAWRGMRELLRSNLDALSGFAVTEQLALALGVPAAVDIALDVQRAKQRDQLLLQEYLLEMAPQALLYRRDA